MIGLKAKRHSTPDDLALIAQVQQGQQAAFGILVGRYEQTIRGTVLGMLGQTVEAEDVAQEVFIRFYKSIDNFRAESSLSTYLTRIAINLCLNELKKRQRDQQRIVPMQGEREQIIQIADQDADLARNDTRQLIEQALQLLSEEFRSVLVLRLVEGYSVRETADILELPQGTVASRLARAQLKMRNLINQLS